MGANVIAASSSLRAMLGTSTDTWLAALATTRQLATRLTEGRTVLKHAFRLAALQDTVFAWRVERAIVAICSEQANKYSVMACQKRDQSVVRACATGDTPQLVRISTPL